MRMTDSGPLPFHDEQPVGCSEYITQDRYTPKNDLQSDGRTAEAGHGRLAS